MPQRFYAIGGGETRRLEVSWNNFWKDFTVRYDGQVLGTIPGTKELYAGQTYTLSNGQRLMVKLVRKLLTVELVVLLDGAPLDDPATDPATMLRNAYAVIFFIAGLNVILGLLAIVTRANIFEDVGVGAISLIYGLAFLGLGFLVRRYYAPALLLAIVLFALDGLLGVVLSIVAGISPNLGGLLFRAALLVPMIQGISAINALQADRPTQKTIQA